MSAERSAGAGDRDPEIARWIARGADANPGIAEPAGLRDQLAARRAAGATDLEARAADLYLAAACTAGDPQAIAALDALLPAIVRPALARIGVPASDDDEIVQRVRVALIAPDERGVPGLAGYTGRGELRAYLRAVAVRIALKRIERSTVPASEDPEDLFAVLPDASDSPELQLIKQRWRDGLRDAFAAAVAALSPRERTLLRQHYVDGLGIDTLGALHQVHRSTCARWIDAARDKILRGLRRHLRDASGLSASDLESALALVRSQLDLSLSRHLASVAPPG